MARNGLRLDTSNYLDGGECTFSRMRPPGPAFRMPSARMKTMKKCAVLLALLLSFGVMSASAQEPPTSDESYDFVLAKLAAEDGQYDETLARLDKPFVRPALNMVLLYQRAMNRREAGGGDNP